MVLAYALVPAGGRTAARGVTGERLRLMTEGRVSAVVGTMSGPPAATAENFKRYDRVLRRLADLHVAVLPARFGMFVGEEEVAEVLRLRQRTFVRALGHVRHRVQMTVRVFGLNAGQMMLPTQPTTKPRVPQHGGLGTQFLLARAADDQRAREVPGFGQVRDAVRRWVRDERVETRPPIATVYHLVARAAAPAYRRALERAAAAHQLRVVVSGPFPPYAFGDDLSR